MTITSAKLPSLASHLLLGATQLVIRAQPAYPFFPIPSKLKLPKRGRWLSQSLLTFWKSSKPAKFLQEQIPTFIFSSVFLVML